MQKQQAGRDVLLLLVTILTFVLLVAETNQNVALDARDIAVSEKISPAGEVKRVIFTHCTVLLCVKPAVSAVRCDVPVNFVWLSFISNE